VASNVKAYAAAVAVNQRLKLTEGGEDFHTLDWLAYGHLMLGRFDDARANVELARAAAKRNPSNARIRDGYLGMRARYLLESEQWENIALDGSDAPAAHDEHGAHDTMPGMPLAQAGGGAWRVYAGISAAKRGDAELAERFAADLGQLREQVAATNPYGARGVAIQQNEVAALAKLARGDREAALALAKEATDIELTLATPSGPPGPMKPAFELYGELLLAANRPAEAVAAFEQALLRTPKRTPSLLGLGRAAAAAGNLQTARRAYTEIAATPGAAPSSPAMSAARAWLAANPE